MVVCSMTFTHQTCVEEKEYYILFLPNEESSGLEAVKQNGQASQHASEDLRNDHTLVLATVKQDGAALEYASEDLQHDDEMVSAARSVDNDKP